MSDKSNPFKPIDKNFSHITKDCSETTFDYVTAEEKVIVKGKGEYTGWTAAIYRINKAANPMTLKGKTVKVKRKSLKKKSKTKMVKRLLSIHAMSVDILITKAIHSVFVG